MYARYEIVDGIALITMDDGKANAIGFDMLDALNDAFDQAELFGAPIVLAGRDKIFCGGFDLDVMRSPNPSDKARLTSAGSDFIVRLLSHPAPVICAIQGHAIAMGFFIALSCDARIGAEGDYKYWANETTIGMTLPVFAQEVGVARLKPSERMNALALAKPYGPDGAKHAGIINDVVARDEVLKAAFARARTLAGYPKQALSNNKSALNGGVISTIQQHVKAQGKVATAS